jgi:SNF family Na+-dependent transporter
MILFALCISLNVFILSQGLAKGIELVSKIGMPLLIVFAMFLAIRGMLLEPGVDPGVIVSPTVGLNFVWEPKYDSLWNPSVWLAAAGQIFFTLSIGMGSIHCYASYLREQDDVTLTGAGAAWTNEFCEVILGGTILLPIAVAYLGLQQVQDMTAGGSGFGLGFMVFPRLFQHWGPGLANAAGFMWFGLLFFAAITSSLAMGQPIMAFLQSEFNFTRRGSAITFGLMLMPLSLPVALTHDVAFNAEFDYWAGTLSLFLFATFEVLCFGWVYGMENSWRELRKGAELQVPRFFYYVIKFVTPALLLTILVGYIFLPKQGWDGVIKSVARGEPVGPWQWSGDGMIGKLLHADIVISPDDPPEKQTFLSNLRIVHDVDRALLAATFAALSYLVFIAWRKRRAEGRTAS